MRSLILGLILTLAGAGAATAEEAPKDDPAREWTVRLGARLGGAFFSYEEDLSSVDTEFTTGAFTSRLSLEGNLFNLTPYLRFSSDLSSGDEEADIQGTIEQENDLAVATLILDIGLGYRIALGQMITVVPSLSYTFDLLSFERERFEQNGVRVQVIDLDGQLQSSVDEVITGNGISARLEIEISPVSLISIHAHAVFTYLPDVRVDNDIGGTISTDGYIVRGGVSAYFWIQPRLGIGGEVEFLFRLLDKSSVKRRTGSAASANVQFPDSETIATAVTFGLLGRF